MDQTFKQNREKFELYLQIGDIKKRTSAWFNLVEESVLDAGEIFEQKERNKYKGRVEVVLEKKDTDIWNIQQAY